jgi:hypothetical protein
MILMDEERRDELYRPGALEARVRLQTALLQKDIFTSLLFGLSKLVTNFIFVSTYKRILYIEVRSSI